MAALTAADILALDDLPRREVACPEWGEGVAVTVRALTLAQRQGWAARIRALGDTPDPGLSTALLVIAGAVGADGNALFAPEQAAQLKDKSAAVMERLADAVMELSGLKERALEIAAKN